MTKSYVYTNRYDLIDGNALSSQMICGLSQPMTTIGFAHAINRKLLSAGLDSIFISGTSVVVHDFNLPKGHAKHPPTNPNKLAASIIEEIKVNAKIRFIFEINIENDDYAEQILKRFKDEMREIMLFMKYGGGKLFPSETVDIFSKETNGFTKNELKESLKNMKGNHGFVIIDRSDLLTEEMTGDEKLSKIIETVSIKRTDGKFKKIMKGTFSPIAIGYRAISKPRKSPTHRNNSGEMFATFAENMISIGEWVSIKKLTSQERGLPKMFWKENDDDTFFYAEAH